MLAVFILNSGLFAQNTGSTPPVQNPNTGSNVNTTTNNSNSGVNPNGNPGTIINNTSNSNSTNNTLTNQNIQPVNSINNTPVILGSNPPDNQWNSNQQLTTIPPVLVDSTYRNAGSIPVVSISAINVTSNAGTNPMPYNRSAPVRKVNADGSARAAGLQTFAAIPLMSTYIPEIALNEIVSRYVDTVYDITKVKQAPDQYVYLVRIEENGVYKTEMVNATGLQ